MAALGSQKRRKGHMKIRHSQPSISMLRKLLNFVGCIVCGYGFFYVVMYSGIPLTLDIVFTIFLAEFCRWSNERRRKCSAMQADYESDHVFRKEKPKGQKLDTVVSVVGYREDPALFTKALESYSRAEHCRLLLVCIDGDAKEDQEMVNVFRKVYPDKSALVHFDIPFAEIALELNRESPKQTPDAKIIAKCCAIAKTALEEQNIRLLGEDAVTRLCVSQPHMHKKGIMFTALILSLVLSDILGIDYLWTSDSDSMISPDALTRTMSTMAGDPRVGGASTALYIHNKDDTVLTQIGNAIYLNELYLARSFSGAVAANDCQSGPCAAFRVTAVREELLGWYKQSVFGHWMVTNEDRHLTTCLLLKGWRCVFAADVLTATESPTTLRRWLLQQVRWSRAVHIESLHRPSVYIMQSPILFLGALRRLVSSFVLPIIIVQYFMSGAVPLEVFSVSDYVRRTALTLVYLGLRNPYRPTMKEWLWSIPANIFYNIPWPAIQVWSFLTVLNDSWGTTMRAQKEISRRSSLRLKVWDVGFFCVWLGIVGGVTGRYTSSTLLQYAEHETAFLFLGTVPTWILSAWWMVVAE